MITITISNAGWGYLTRLPNTLRDLRSGVVMTPDRRHTLQAIDGGEILAPGIPDGELLGGVPYAGGYGYVRHWDVQGDPKEREVEDDWRHARPAYHHLDYYVALHNGSPFPEAVAIYYAERVFVSGKDTDRNPLPRYRLLEHLAKFNLAVSEPRTASHAMMWHPCQIFHGLKAGMPLFEHALRAATELGPTWHQVVHNLSGQLPEGYHWWRPEGCRYGQLHILETS